MEDLEIRFNTPRIYNRNYFVPLKGEPIECIIPFPIMRIVFVQVESTEIEIILGRKGAMENSGSDTIKATPLFFDV